MYKTNSYSFARGLAKSENPFDKQPSGGVQIEIKMLSMPGKKFIMSKPALSRIATFPVFSFTIFLEETLQS